MGTFQELPEISCTLFDEGPGFHCSLTKTHLAYAKTLPELCYFPQGIVPECIRAYEHCELKHLQARDGTSAPDPRLFKKCVKDELEEFHGSLNQSKDDLPKKKHWWDVFGSSGQGNVKRSHVDGRDDRGSQNTQNWCPL
ncbi:hypothetical protein PLIIFM63780_006290 [Purpureocillium lilacinum]|nr:hypothetical protein PLIIFM63780_006290 [Purpureocillium lilacinum]